MVQRRHIEARCDLLHLSTHYRYVPNSTMYTNPIRYFFCYFTLSVMLAHTGMFQRKSRACCTCSAEQIRPTSMSQHDVTPRPPSDTGDDDNLSLRENIDEDSPVNEFISAGDFEGWHKTLSTKALMRLGKSPIKDISFDDEEMCHILENIRDMNNLSDPDIDPKEKTCQVDFSFGVPI